MAFKLVNRDRLMKPNKCIVCERKPQARVVDTGHNFMRATISENMRGRKYVCDKCGQLVAKALGFLSLKQSQDMKEEIIRLQNEVALLKDAADLQVVIERLTERLPEKEDDGTPATVENQD